MYSYRSSSATWVITFFTAILLGSLRLFAQGPDADPQTVPPAIPVQEQPEVLSRGPVHEAFAAPVIMQTQEGLIAPQQPPAPIEEVPPAEKPQGSQFVWIPGYWSWDADRSGYIWVSACWRAAPPKMSWVPGYWVQASGGWKWTAGYWAPAAAKEIVYLPGPPAIEDIEPVAVQPSPDMIWVPPCMYWSNGQYIRRAGYWMTAQPDWIWVPSHYVVTPRGYIFAEGHWDYSLDRRGVLFAPVYFPASVHLRAGFTFSPAVVVDTGLLRVSLFTYPRYCHYYFGDYYDSAYLSIGIFPRFDSHRHHIWYDPVYEHDRWCHRSDSRWEEHERNEYRRRCDDKDLRPAHTFREQESRRIRLSEPQRQASQLVRPIGEPAVAGRKSLQKFEKIDIDRRQKISKQAAAVRKFSDDRNRWESSAAGSRTTQPSMERKADVTPSSGHKRTIQPVEETKTTVIPSVDRQQIIPPAEGRKAARTVSGSQQEKERTFGSPRESQVSRPERVQIPASPVVGNSGRQSFFRKGLPAQPTDESKDYMDTNLRRE
ncbi:MAG: hypothetical protein WCG03_00390 [Kiritimatiellales bacterium]